MQFHATETLKMQFHSNSMQLNENRRNFIQLKMQLHAISRKPAPRSLCVSFIDRMIVFERFYRVVTMPNRKGYRAEGRLTFLALLPEIEKALGLGRSLKGFHEEHRDRLGISYAQLTRHWRAYKAARAQGAKPVSVRQLEPKPERSFRFDPTDAYRAAPPFGAAPAKAPSGPAETVRPLSTGSEKKRDFHYDPMDAYRFKFD